jgi:thiol-disulfide isomerase/thioredoxin
VTATVRATNRVHGIEGGEQFAEQLLATVAESGALLVVFTATWCGPCRELHPELERYAAEAPPTVRVVLVDVDAVPELAERYGIDAMPTLLLLAHGEPVLRTTEPRTCARLHETIDELAARALATDARADYPIGVAVAAAARTAVLPRGVDGEFSFSAYPGRDASRDGVTIETAGPAGELHRVSVPAGWRSVARVRAGTDTAAAAVLAQLGEHDVDDVVLVLDGPPGRVVDELARLVSIRRLRIESPALPGHDLAKLARLSGLRTLDLNTMGDAVDAAQLRQLRALLPNTIVNGTWMASHLAPPSESEAR